MRVHLKNGELGMIQALLERFQKVDIPRLLSLKEKADMGECLGEFDLTFLDTLRDELKTSEEFAEHHAEFQHLVTEIIDLYHHITETAVKNAQHRL